MNKDKIQKFQIFSAIFAIILGTILHFTYDWSNQNPIIAAFSSINESTWEHLKLAFYPMLITSIIGFFIFSKDKNFLCSKVLGILVALSFITIFFYTYTGILGRNIALIDISSFIIAIILGECISFQNISLEFNCNNKISIIILVILLLCFIFFTYNPPEIQLFQDPITGLYGI